MTGGCNLPPVLFSSIMIGYIIFFLCLALLVLGYVFYGRMAQQVYGLELSKEMPCVKMPDGVDFVPLPTWRVFLIQLFNPLLQFLQSRFIGIGCGIQYIRIHRLVSTLGLRRIPFKQDLPSFPA